MLKTNISGRVFALAAIAVLIQPSTAQPTDSDIVNAVRFRCIGPGTMSGRISDIDVDPRNTSVVYVATASGGVWKSTSGGIEWTPIFDSQPVQSIGDVEVSRADSNIVWVGTGENTNRNSVAWGDGIYKSTDAGGTWTNTGLERTEQIARIITHPTNKDIVWVAAIGALWSSSPDRGVYKTTDGGRTWSKILYVDENTGCSDLVIDPKNANVLYAGMYERRRWPWTFRSGGPNGGVFKSTDGGKTWTKLGNGLPTGLTGKIGLSIFPKNPNIVYAIVEAEGSQREPEKNRNGIYRSDDAGKTWKRQGVHSTRPFYYHEIMVDPEDPDLVYSLSTQMMRSRDGGKTWQAMPNRIHVDYHAIWINPRDVNHIWVGNDGGVAVSYDKGATWRHSGNIIAAQFYAIGVDMATPYWVYGGLQDNGTWGGPSISRNRRGIGNYEWKTISGGDGFHVQVDWLDNETIYSESQGGAIQRTNKRTGERRGIRPPNPEGERIRYNWSSPIVMSPHNPRIIWFGGNRLFKTVNGGDAWQVVSPDLTTNNPEKTKPMEGLNPENTGAEVHCTIISISESPIRPDVVWVGTDDGLVHYTLNGGVEWTSVSDNFPGLPANTWCSRVIASKYKLERAYATFDGHRTGDYKPYIYVTEDMGKTWEPIGTHLPVGPVYVIKEDPEREDLLYVGTEFGTYVSLNRGVTWIAWRANMPAVAVHDIVIHPREKEIVLGTHGRGIWIAPVEHLQGLSNVARSQPFYLVDPVAAYAWVPDLGGGYGDGQGWFYGENPRTGARIHYYLQSQPADLKIEIVAPGGEVIATVQNPRTSPGLNTVYWNLRRTPQERGGGGFQRGGAGPTPTGDFVVRITVGSESMTKPLKVYPDPLAVTR